MKKNLKRIVLCACISGIMWGWNILSDREKLNENLIRLHVVANSDSAGDQTVKLKVRDAVIESVSQAMADAGNLEEARTYIQKNLPVIRKAAGDCLKALGCDDQVEVRLGKESFDTRQYDTFSLPAGVYESLRISIGEGKGKNWWCVVFPSLCVPATGEGFADVAAGSGFPDALTATLEGKQGYEIRFYLLDLLGKVEGYFFKG